ncbi:glycosyl hydrolase family 8, partial [Yoonia sp.]|uniref:glycosyl hydrolase family 8 n=1 Tax=Yoonia sp. TaxID=2212373 RepID=UPI003976A22E
MDAPANKPAFLNVAPSVTGRRWVGPTVEEDRLSEAMAQKTGLAAPLCRVLVRQGVSAQDAAGFLAPTLRDLLPDPRVLKDMDRATDRFLYAVGKRERIAVFADYDVDGGTSAALLICWLRDMGLQATLYVPDRIDEGYGPNDAAMSALAKDHDLIICVDCGTLSHGPIAAAVGADVIVLDHHLGGETLPDAVAVVNPNRQDETGDLAHLCAAGVVFLMLVDANRLSTRHAISWRVDTSGNIVDAGAATDADTDIAFALIQASKRWGGAPAGRSITYAQYATNHLSKVKQYCIADDNSLKPGDVWDDHEFPSYYSEAFYREYNVHEGNTSWDNLTSMCNQHIIANHYGNTHITLNTGIKDP